MLIRTIIVSIVVAACTVMGASEELLKNGGLEEYDSETSRFTSFKFSKKMDNYRALFFSQVEPGKSGKYALKVIGLKGHSYNRYGMVMEQNVGLLHPGERYTLSFQAKGKGVPGPEKFAAVELRQLRADGHSVCYNTIRIDLSARDWKFYDLTFLIQKETSGCILRIVTRNLGSDDAFILDDLSMKQVEK